jgi:hypothetical protein
MEENLKQQLKDSEDKRAQIEIRLQNDFPALQEGMADRFH